MCHKRGKEGHFARGCAATYYRFPVINGKPYILSMGKLTALYAKGQADDGSCVETQTHNSNELLYSVDATQFETML